MGMKIGTICATLGPDESGVPSDTLTFVPGSIVRVESFAPEESHVDVQLLIGAEALDGDRFRRMGHKTHFVHINEIEPVSGAVRLTKL